MGKAAKKAKSKAKSGGGRGGMFGKDRIGGSSLFEVGAIMTVGAIILGKICSLPSWMSPVGVALWLWGYRKNNQALRTLGLLMLGVGFANTLGIPQAIGAKIDEARAKGFLGGLFNMGGGAQPNNGNYNVQPQTGPTSTSGVDLAGIANIAGASADVIRAVAVLS